MDNQSDVLGIVIAFFVQFLPLLLIPFSFKLAGGLVGKISQLLGGYNSKVGEMIRGNPNDPFSLQNRVKRNALEKMTRKQNAVIARGREKNADGSFGRSGWARARSRFASAVGGNVQERMSGYNKAANDRMEMLSGHWDDGLIYAGGGYKLAAGQRNFSEQGMSDADFASTVGNRQRFMNSRGEEISEGLYVEGKSKYGNSISSLGQTFNYTLRKAQNDGHIDAFKFALGENAKQQNWGQTEMDAVYPAAAYPHKGKFMSQWYDKPSVGPGGDVTWTGPEAQTEGGHANYDNMTKDMHRNLQQYMESGQHDRVVRTMTARQKEFEGRIDADDISRASGGPGTYTDTVDSTGKVLKTAAQNRQRDVDSLGRTYELFDNISSEYATGGYGVPGEASATPGTPGGAVATKTTASGTTAAAKPYVEEAVRSRKFEFRERGGLDQSTGQRDLVRKGDGAKDDARVVARAITGDRGSNNLFLP